MRPTPGRMFFLYMRDCENEICITAQEWKLEKIKHRKWRKQNTGSGENKTQEVEKTKHRKWRKQKSPAIK